MGYTTLNISDEEKQSVTSPEAAFYNHSVASISWHSVTVAAGRKNKRQFPKVILEDVSGVCHAGEMVALMGPSGSGKTTLLDCLAQRRTATLHTENGSVWCNGRPFGVKDARRLSSYVEQEDTLIGTLTVRETLRFAGRLALTGKMAPADIKARADDLIVSFGLESVADTIIGTPIKKGISGGQKRRVSVASQLISGPSILFLDEPTSGLDSTASHEVMSFLSQAAKKYNLCVVSSIHQPSTKTFKLFDSLCLLSEGTSCYFGPISEVASYFADIGFPNPPFMNPVEHILDLTNLDFMSSNGIDRNDNLVRLKDSWRTSQHAQYLSQTLQYVSSEMAGEASERSFALPEQRIQDQIRVPLILIERAFIKSTRDVFAYHIRIVMYVGLAILMGTVWLRLKAEQESIQSFINAIFFGSAFMSFMAVAYVPAFLEDRSAYVRERSNGLYGPLSFTVANFVVGIPYLFLTSMLFSCITYWLIGFEPTASAFFTWISWLFLDLLAAESMVVLLASLLPNFVISLACIAFANGLWMSVGGFLVSPKILNVFWRYVFHYVDYQAYVFQGMMVNEFQHRTYACGEACHCMYESILQSQCLVDGNAILQSYGYKPGKEGEWVGILLAIISFFRVAGYAVNWFKKR